MARAILSRAISWAQVRRVPSSRLVIPRPVLLSPLAPARRLLTTTPPLRKAPKIITPVSSVASSVDRLLPPSLAAADLPLDRDVAREIVSKVLNHLRQLPDIKTVEAAQKADDEFAQSIREDLTRRNLTSSSLRQLSSLIIAATSDPRRHPVASNLYSIAFGADPASLPAVHLDSRDVTGVAAEGPLYQSKASSAASATTSSSAAGTADGRDWQSAYSWASLVLQGRAPPPIGATRLPTAAERSAALAAQNAAAYRVFAHLALRGHPRGIFGLAKHLLATLEKSTLGAAGGSTSSSMTRQETVAEVERLYRLAGEGGVEEAWFELGALYAEGKWVRKDDARARSFLDEGVARDSPRACQTLAQLLTRDANALGPAAPSSLEIGAETTDPAKQGDAATKRIQLLQRALHLFERGARLGSAECAFSAGMRYLLQVPSPSDAEQQRQQQQQSAKDDDPLANMDLSLDGGPSSAQEPTPLQSEQKHNDKDSTATARREHFSKWGTDPSDEAAAQWFRVAAQGGDAPAMMNLARMFLEGRVPVRASSSSERQSESERQSGDKAATLSGNASAEARQQQLVEASNLYARILAKAMGPEGQRAKALAEAQAAAKGVQNAPEPGLGSGSGRLDDLGVRAQEGLRMVREEMEALAGRGQGR